MLLEDKVFRDPIYGYVYVQHELIWNLINTKEFQRLRRIKQLGGVSMVFHTAEHSRFSHSLGVYEVSRKITGKLSDYFTFEEKLIVLCAALLHDVGHGPFSHAFETIFNTTHEKFTVDFITGDSEINAVLENYEEGFSEKVATVIDKTYENPLVVSVISSQFDADRLDYLIRDAYHTGVSYGKLDLDRFIRIMKVKDNKLVLKETGVNELESYILGRYHMYYQIYYHPNSRSFEYMVKTVLERAKDLFVSGYEFDCNIDFLIPFFINKVSIDDYYMLDDFTVYHYFKEFTRESDEVLSDLSTRILRRDLFKFKKVSEVDYDKLSIYLKEKGLDPKYYLYQDKLNTKPYRLYKGNGTDSQQIWIDTTEGIKELSEVSEIVSGIIKGHDNFDEKIFFPKV